MFQLIGFLSGVVSMLGYPVYLRDIASGSTRPERASWFIWTLLGIIAFVSQKSAGAGSSLWLAGVQAVGVGAIFLYSLKKGVGGWTGWDIFGLSVAAIGLILWHVTKHPVVAILSVLLADAAATALTLPKAYREPESETLFAWGIDVLAGVLGVLSVGSLEPVLLLYPAYIALSNTAVTAAILLGRRRLRLLAA
jgi:hypothetical protein